MLAIRLDPDLERRLSELAVKTGRSKTFYARAAIAEYIDDLEDHYLAAETMKEFDPKKTVSLDQVKRELGLED